MTEKEFQNLPKFGRVDPEQWHLAEIARLTAELAASRERERVLREAGNALAVAVNSAGICTCTDGVRCAETRRAYKAWCAALGEDGGND